MYPLGHTIRNADNSSIEAHRECATVDDWAVGGVVAHPATRRERANAFSCGDRDLPIGAIGASIPLVRRRRDTRIVSPPVVMVSRRAAPAYHKRGDQ